MTLGSYTLRPYDGWYGEDRDSRRYGLSGALARRHRERENKPLADLKLEAPLLYVSKSLRGAYLKGAQGFADGKQWYETPYVARDQHRGASPGGGTWTWAYRAAWQQGWADARAVAAGNCHPA